MTTDRAPARSDISSHCRDAFGLSLPLEWCSHFVHWRPSGECRLKRGADAKSSSLASRFGPDGNERDARRPSSQRPGAGAPDAYALRALKADHGAQLAPSERSHWADIGLLVLRSIPENRLLATAGGVAFFALMAIFPALATIVSLYGLFADPQAIPERLAILAGVVPASVIDLLRQQVLSLAENHTRTLSIAFLIGFLASMWSANSGVSALFDALNVVHGTRETRGLLQFYMRTLTVTLGSVVYGLLALIGVLPVVFRFVGLSQHADILAAVCRWPVTLLIVMIGLSIVYRIGPSRSDARWRWVTPGSSLAAVLLVALSMIFTWYVAEFDSYNRIYGSLGAVVGFMTWIWLSVVIVLIGAELDAAIETRTSREVTGRVVRSRTI
jgi:membrane protein